MLGPYHFCPLSSPSCIKCSLGISNFLEEISSLSHSVVFLDFFALCQTLQPHGLKPARLLCPWDSLGKNTGVGCHFLLQEIFLFQG